MVSFLSEHIQTNYQRIQNLKIDLNMAINQRFFSTISLNLRYDDGIAKNEDFDMLFYEINELEALVLLQMVGKAQLFL